MSWLDFYNYNPNPYKPSNNTDELSIPHRLDQIKVQKNRLLAEEGKLIEKGLQSMNPDILMKANSAWEDVQQKNDVELGKSILIDPNKWNDSEGYKRKPVNISGFILRKMARQTPVIRAIISTRQTQVSAFSRPQSNRFDTGFIVRKKKDYYTSEEPKLSTSDKQTIKYLTEFLLNGGDEDNAWYADNFDTFLRKVTEDTLILDAGTFEVVRNQKGLPVKYFAVDGETIRIADSYDDEDYDGDRDEIRGYYPSFVQVVDGNVEADYYPWELCYGIRNASTDIHRNGYGRSELEDLVNIVTWMLYGDAYNGKFFTQGSAPRGLIRVSKNVNRNRLAQFRQSWQATVSGTQNAWKIPVIESEEMEWVDLQKTNAEMQFALWQEYLIKICCAIYKIAPEEIGFNLGNANGGNALFEGNNEVKLKYSRYKGLRPLLKQIEFWINKFIINPLDSDFEFVFVGLDTETEEKELELLNKKVANGMGWKEWRRAQDMPEDFEEGDFPLNPVYLQMKQQEQFNAMQEENTQAIEEESNDLWDSLTDNATKSIQSMIPGHEDNPMMFDAIQFYEQEILTD